MLQSAKSAKSVIAITSKKSHAEVADMDTGIGISPRACISLGFSATYALSDRLMCNDTGYYFTGNADHGLGGLRGRLSRFVACQTPDRRVPWRRYFNAILTEAEDEDR
jgi:hypothetical protein